MSSRRQYPTVPATSRRGISARFDGDISYVLIDVSLFRRRVATSGRGCRPQRVDFLQGGRRSMAAGVFYVGNDGRLQGGADTTFK